MTSLMFGHLSGIGVPADEVVVRSTATPVEHDAPAAVQEDMPMPNEVETDSNPHLGMVNRQLASDWHEGVRGVPAWIPEVDAVSNSATIINSQVSSSGTAAARESSGVTIKNMSYAVGIEPVSDLVDGHKMGNEYFTTNPKLIQSTMTDSMSLPPGSDQQTSGKVSALGKDNARKAAQAAIYNSYWNEGK